MKALIGLLLGFVAGVVLVLAALYYAPFNSSNERVPIANEGPGILQLQTGSHLGGAVAYTNSGLERLPVSPANIEQLLYPANRGAHMAVHAMRNEQGEIVGLGVKMFAWSDESRLLFGKVLSNSVWNVMLPGTGSYFVAETENYWPFVKNVALPAWQASDTGWQGDFTEDTTVGPLGTTEGIMMGGNGVLRGQRGTAKESLSISDYAMGVQHTVAT
ncbi:MAG: hypothetical protein AAF385_12120, partial [Pseudomonadota bacterium]